MSEAERVKVKTGGGYESASRGLKTVSLQKLEMTITKSPEDEMTRRAGKERERERERERF